MHGLGRGDGGAGEPANGIAEARQVFAGGLAGFHGFFERDGFGDVADRFEAALFCFVEDGEVHVVLEHGVDFDLVDAGVGKLVDGGAALVGGVADFGEGPDGRAAVADSAGGDHLGAELFAGVELVAGFEDRRGEAGHVADEGDAVGDEEAAVGLGVDVVDV